MDSLRLTAVAAATLAAACALAVRPTRARPPAARARTRTRAWAAARPSAAPTVRHGHVDGWVGVGGPGLGPNGTDEWIQIGFTSISGDSLNRIYYEIQRPGHKDEYRELRHDVPVGAHHRFAVRELAGRRNWRPV